MIEGVLQLIQQKDENNLILKIHNLDLLSVFDKKVYELSKPTIFNKIEFKRQISLTGDITDVFTQ